VCILAPSRFAKTSSTVFCPSILLVITRMSSINTTMKQKVRPTQNVVPCWECSRRRLVCDLGTPKCRKCRVRGVDCPGYQHKPLQWMRPGQTRSKGAQSTKTLGVSGPPTRSDEVISNCTFLGQETPTRVQKRKASEDSKVEDASSAPVFEVQPATRCTVLRNIGDRSTFRILTQAVVYCLSHSSRETRSMLG
jgi:hypothetical protein